MKIHTSKPMISSQTAFSARMMPARSHLQPKVTPTIRPDHQPQQPLEALYNRACAQAAAVLLAGLVVSSPISPAFAADTNAPSSGNPLRAVAEFYRNRQQANGGSLFLGPIQLSRQRLENAATALQGSDIASEQEATEKYSTALQAVRGASLDCIVFDFEGKQDLTTAASSEQEYKFGDPCKLRLVVKNATTLTRDKTLVAETEAKMHLIIRQLQLLDDRLDRATQGEAEAGKDVPELLKEAVSTNIEFEDDIKRCLGLDA